jgi:hypothetical protein
MVQALLSESTSTLVAEAPVNAHAPLVLDAPATGHGPFFVDMSLQEQRPHPTVSLENILDAMFST